MKTLPTWLTLSADAATIQLARAATMNGVRVDRITLRYPTVGDVRAAEKQSPSDQAERELILFANLAGVGPRDLEGLSMRDYRRVQEGYFRLDAADDDQYPAVAPGLPSAGD
ncbi:phage tail assembly protein [Chitiniphilus eburneus]|uniref:phage tail assembly protein n=1 Tax=Chitiniphilus eburneus TaxID=2571148 RepID=UPI0035D059FF